MRKIFAPNVILIISVIIYSVFVFDHVQGQGKNIRGRPFKIIADSLERNKQFKQAAQMYLVESSLRTMVPFKMDAFANAAYSYAEANMPDSALHYFYIAARKYGFNDMALITRDTLLARLKEYPQYTRLIGYFRKRLARQSDPDNVRFETGDIALFWKVYDKYKKDTTNAAELFVSQYFEKGSWALQDYYRLKTKNIGGIQGFIHNMAIMPNYYAGVRKNTLKVKLLGDTLRRIFARLKEWYPPSIFLRTTFVIGGWSSGGTSTDYGAIVGCDMQAIDENTSLNELNPWQKANVKLFSAIKYIVAHELIHVQQHQMAGDTTLLNFAIKEGMADFLGELISGKTANEQLFVWARGKEKQIWDDFKKEMYLNRYSNWIANSSQQRPDHPADLGYWVGYQICKSYFDEATDKKQAVYDMLHIQDYRKFLTDSKFDEKVNGL
jgi:hypothetical protein